MKDKLTKLSFAILFSTFIGLNVSGCKKEEIPNLVGTWMVHSYIEDRLIETDSVRLTIPTGDFEIIFRADETGEIPYVAQTVDWDYFNNEKEITIIRTKPDGSFFTSYYSIETNNKDYQGWFFTNGKEISQIAGLESYNIKFWELTRIK